MTNKKTARRRSLCSTDGDTNQDYVYAHSSADHNPAAPTFNLCGTGGFCGVKKPVRREKLDMRGLDDTKN
jgi:hypothetical protein